MINSEDLPTYFESNDPQAEVRYDNKQLKAELESLKKERQKLQAMVIRRDRAIQLIHNHAYDPNCPCAICSMYAAEGWEAI